MTGACGSTASHAVQLLLTAEDLDDRTRYLNVRNTLLALFEFSAIPIINENDTVSVEELKTPIGENDRLAAMVTNLIRWPLLILLSDVDGLFYGDPAQSGLPASCRPFCDSMGRSPPWSATTSPSIEQGRDGQQDRSRPAGHFGRRKCDHCQRPHAWNPGQDSRPANPIGTLFCARSVDPLVETLDRIHRPAARDYFTVDAVMCDRRHKAAVCWPSASRGPSRISDRRRRGPGRSNGERVCPRADELLDGRRDADQRPGRPNRLPRHWGTVLMSKKPSTATT